MIIIIVFYRRTVDYLPMDGLVFANKQYNNKSLIRVKSVRNADCKNHYPLRLNISDIY